MTNEQTTKPTNFLISYDVDEKGTIMLPSGPPFDGNPVLIRLGKGWCEAYWAPLEIYETLEYPDYTGFCWVCLDGDFEEELDAARAWAPLPANPETLSES